MSNQIMSYFHCARCITDNDTNLSPRDYARFEVGLTPDGIQVWCVRHDCNVAHINADDLEILTKGNNA